MAKEALYIPEENLQEVIEIIREGLRAKPETTPNVREALLTWCQEEEDYLKSEG